MNVKVLKTDNVIVSHFNCAMSLVDTIPRNWIRAKIEALLQLAVFSGYPPKMNSVFKESK